MRAAALDQLIVDTYAVHFVLWNLGVTPDEIFVQAALIANAPKPGVHATVTVKRAGKSWVMWLDRLEGNPEILQFEAAWRDFASRQPELSEDAKDALVARSRAIGQMEEIRQGLLAKGILASN